MIDNPQTDRRERYAAAIRAAGDTAYGNRPFYEAITDAVIALADTELAARRAADLRDAEEICDEAGASYTAKALNDHAAGAYELMARFRRKAEEAEQTAAAVPVLAATPPPVSRADILREAADRMSEKASKLTEGLHDLAHFVAKDRLREAEILDREAAELRRVAAEAQQQEPTAGLEGTLVRVRNLHAPDANGHCGHCHRIHPCPTIDALDHDAEAQQQPDTEFGFVPPAAVNLPAGTLEAAEIGANRLDAWARTAQGRNFLAHALVQLARTGWLRTEPGEGFEPVRDRDETPAPEQPAPGPGRVADEEQPSPTEALLATRCDACRHTLKRHHQHGACTVVLCVCGTFQYPVEELPR